MLFRTQPQPSLARHLVRGGAWVLAARFFSSGGTFVSSLLLTRLLDRSEVGTYFLALSVASALAIVARSGLERTVLNAVANLVARNYWSSVRRTFSRTLLLLSASVGITATMTLAFGTAAARELFPSSSIDALTGLLSLWLAVLAFEMVLAEAFRGLDRIADASLFGGGLSRALVVGGLLTVIGVSGNLSLSGAIALSIAAIATSVALALGRLSHIVRRFRYTDEAAPTYSEIIRTASPLMISNLSFFVMTSVDLWIVGARLAADEVGLYAIAARLVLLVGTSVSIVNAVLPPVISQLRATGEKQQLERVLRGAASLAGVPSGLVLLLFVVFGGGILAVTFGDSYRSAWPVLAALSVGQLVAVWAGSCGYLLLMSGHHSAVMWTAITGGVVTTVGALLTVGTHGIVGVSISSAIGLIFQQVLMLVVAHRYCGVWTHAGPRHLLDAARRGFSLIR